MLVLGAIGDALRSRNILTRAFLTEHCRGDKQLKKHTLTRDPIGPDTDGMARPDPPPHRELAIPSDQRAALDGLNQLTGAVGTGHSLAWDTTDLGVSAG